MPSPKLRDPVMKQGASDNGQPEVELDLDIDELRERLGIVALEAKIAAHESILSEWLTYVNQVDERVRQLLGEPTITKKTQMNVQDGLVQVLQERPALPGNLTGPGQMGNK